MTNIVLSGCNGKMGKVVTACINKRDDCKIVAGIDLNTEMLNGYPVFSNFSDIDKNFDVIIDFSHPSALPNVLGFSVSNNIPIVIATTGLSDADIANVKAASKSTPVFFTFNMSLGVNLLVQLAQKAAAVLGDEFDIEIVEKHHNQKIDAPSGTAIMLANSINEVFNNKLNYEYDRHSKSAKRPKNEIGMHSIRGGTIVGEHEVIFAGHDEVITISHSAASKEVFAVGAVNAATYIVGCKPGMYDMKNLVESR
ncbi:MAG: 4-hydroxy-tetrahydrodipicolinate reductase [Oscillospiraceae bacterium]|nr:4-hydroxy-tetrahydrodipicolinate reductase [Oscillospiraceae bacterium]